MRTADLLTDGLTINEVARELFTAGYLQALDDVEKTLRIHGDSLAKLRDVAATVSARAAIAKATREAA